MAADLILGKEVAEEVFVDLRKRIEALKQAGTVPGLAVILVGDDPASQVYVRNKVRKCEELGMRSVKIEMPATTSQEELLAKVAELKKDLFFLRMQHATNQLDNPVKISAVKKDIARIKTIIREKQTEI
jgi:ribosomal protein L29